MGFEMDIDGSEKNQVEGVVWMKVEGLEFEGKKRERPTGEQDLS